jgi:hypothetical protein
MLAFALFLACEPHTIKLGADSGVVSDIPDDTGAADTSMGDSAAGDSATGDSAADDSANDTGGPSDTGPSDTGTDTGSRPPCRPASAIVQETLTLESGSNVRGYTGGAWGSTSTATDASVALNAEGSCAATVTGTLAGILWTLGDPSTVVCLGWGGSVTTTRQLTATATTTEPSAAIPPPSEGEVSIAYGATRHLDRDTRFDRLRLEGASRLVIDAPLALHVDREFSSAGTVELAPGATLSLYVGGSLRLEWGSSLNPNGDATAAQVHLTDDENVVLAYGSSAVMQLDAPGSAVALEGATLAGTVTARTLRATWGTGLHLDAAGVCAR